MKWDCLSIVGIKGLDSFTVGAGFLASVRNRIYIVTAAHVPSNDTGFADFSIWPPQISVVPDAEGSLGNVDLFVDGRPNFLFRRAADGGMSDMMAIPVYDLPRASRVFEITDENPPTHGDELIGFGFPERADTKRPYWPPDRIVGQFIREANGSWRTSLPVKKGHSGGPVLRNGKLCGMIIGWDDDCLGTVIPVSHLLLLFP